MHAHRNWHHAESPTQGRREVQAPREGGWGQAGPLPDAEPPLVLGRCWFHQCWGDPCQEMNHTFTEVQSLHPKLWQPRLPQKPGTPERALVGAAVLHSPLLLSPRKRPLGLRGHGLLAASEGRHVAVRAGELLPPSPMVLWHRACPSCGEEVTHATQTSPEGESPGRGTQTDSAEAGSGQDAGWRLKASRLFPSCVSWACV